MKTKLILLALLLALPTMAQGNSNEARIKQMEDWYRTRMTNNALVAEVKNAHIWRTRDVVLVAFSSLLFGIAIGIRLGAVLVGDSNREQREGKR